MIQRIQSVYLILAVVALALLLLSELVQTGSNLARWGTLLFGVPALAGAVGAVFLYKDRIRQRRLIVATQVCTIMAVVVLYGSLYVQGVLHVRTSAGLDVVRLVTLVLPLVAYLCLILARRGVSRDIKLVEGMDRIR